MVNFKKIHKTIVIICHKVETISRYLPKQRCLRCIIVIMSLKEKQIVTLKNDSLKVNVKKWYENQC